MKALKIEAGKNPEVVEIERKLESLQEAVGGYIELLYPFDEEVALICNEEGKMLGLDLNRALYNEKNEVVDIIAGTFLVVGAPSDSEDFASLTDEQIEKYKQIYENPEEFITLNGHIFAIPVN